MIQGLWERKSKKYPGITSLKRTNVKMSQLSWKKQQRKFQSHSIPTINHQYCCYVFWTQHMQEGDFSAQILPALKIMGGEGNNQHLLPCPLTSDSCDWGLSMEQDVYNSFQPILAVMLIEEPWRRDQFKGKGGMMGIQHQNCCHVFPFLEYSWQDAESDSICLIHFS